MQGTNWGRGIGALIGPMLVSSLIVLCYTLVVNQALALSDDYVTTQTRLSMHSHSE